MSKLKNSGCNFFNKQKRNLMGFKANPSPGPGSYRVPSDFGYYETVKPMKWNKLRIKSAPAWKNKKSRSRFSTRRSKSRGLKKRPRTSSTIRR